MSAGSDVWILPSGAHEKFPVSAEERGRKRRRPSDPAEGQEAVAGDFPTRLGMLLVQGCG